MPWSALVNHNLDRGIRADNRTHGTTGTSAGILHHSRKIPHFVRVRWYNDTILRTRLYAKFTTFASFGIYLYFSSHEKTIPSLADISQLKKFWLIHIASMIWLCMLDSNKKAHKVQREIIIKCFVIRICFCNFCLHLTKANPWRTH